MLLQVGYSLLQPSRQLPSMVCCLEEETWEETQCKQEWGKGERQEWNGEKGKCDVIMH